MFIYIYIFNLFAVCTVSHHQHVTNKAVELINDQVCLLVMWRFKSWPEQNVQHLQYDSLCFYAICTLIRLLNVFLSRPPADTPLLLLRASEHPANSKLLCKKRLNLCYICSLFQQLYWIFFFFLTRCLLPLGLFLMQCFQRLCVQNVFTIEPGNIPSVQLHSGRRSHSDVTQQDQQKKIWKPCIMSIGVTNEWERFIGSKMKLIKEK